MTETLLVGWKQIALFMGCSVRTAKKYHYEGCMPVMRGGSMPVRASRAQLRMWYEGYCARIKT